MVHLQQLCFLFPHQLFTVIVLLCFLPKTDSTPSFGKNYIPYVTLSEMCFFLVDIKIN